MWIPKSEAEIVEFVTKGNLNESTTFDAKRELTSSSKEIAKDIAAMANDGGVLLYGVDEDSVTKRPTILSPFPLAGEPERITNIVRTCIAEPPEVQIATFQDAKNPAIGYIAVIVPPSPRAPHMVIVNGDRRYYGRTDTGNIPLTEGEVARLYARREKWEFDMDSHISQTIQRAPIAPSSEAAYLHLVCRPVSASDELVEKACKGLRPGDLLNDLIRVAASDEVFPGRSFPDFAYPQNWFHRADGWAAYFRDDPQDRPNRHPHDVLDMQVNHNGAAWLFCGRAAVRADGRLYSFEKLIAGLTTRLLFFLGELYERADYVGLLDVGIAVTGLRGAIPHDAKLSGQQDELRPFDQPEYRRATRTSAFKLKENAQDVARMLVMPLVRATTQGRFRDPFVGR